MYHHGPEMANASDDYDTPPGRSSIETLSFPDKTVDMSQLRLVSPKHTELSLGNPLSYYRVLPLTAVMTKARAGTLASLVLVIERGPSLRARIVDASRGEL